MIQRLNTVYNLSDQVVHVLNLGRGVYKYGI